MTKSRRPREDPAYSKPGTGEDFPARRPGVRIGEDRSGRKILQPTRATQARRQVRARAPRSTPIPRPPRQPKIVPIPPAGRWNPNGRKRGGVQRKRWV